MNTFLNKFNYDIQHTKSGNISEDAQIESVTKKHIMLDLNHINIIYSYHLELNMKS